MLQDSTEEPSSKRERYEYREGSGPSTGQPPPSYSAQRVSSVKFLMCSSRKNPYPPHGRFFGNFLGEGLLKVKMHDGQN